MVMQQVARLNVNDLYQLSNTLLYNLLMKWMEERLCSYIACLLTGR